MAINHLCTTEEFFRSHSIDECNRIIEGSKQSGRNFYSLKDKSYWPKSAGSKNDICCISLSMLTKGKNKNGNYVIR